MNTQAITSQNIPRIANPRSVAISCPSHIWHTTITAIDVMCRDTTGDRESEKKIRSPCSETETRRNLRSDRSSTRMPRSLLSPELFLDVAHNSRVVDSQYCQNYSTMLPEFFHFDFFHQASQCCQNVPKQSKESLRPRSFEMMVDPSQKIWRAYHLCLMCQTPNP